MRLQRLRFELRMKLAANKMWMAGNLDHFDVRAIRSRPGDSQPAGNHRVFIFTVELVAVTMAFADFGLRINLVRQRVGLNLARPCPQSHGSAKFLHTTQFAQLVNYAMRSRLIELAGIRTRQAADVSGKLDTGSLHAETNTEVGHLLLARILNRF